MKRVVVVLVATTLLLAAAASAIYYSAAGQDAVFRRLATVVMDPGAPDTFDGLRVVVCGSASPLGNNPDRAQACIAVVTPEHFLLFDVGAGSVARMRQAQLPMARVTGVFLTHFHSDHIASLPDVNLNSWVAGRKDNLDVYGPPGIDSVIEGFNLAYALDRRYRVKHHGEDLLPPGAGPMHAVDITPGDVAWQDNLLKVTSFEVNHSPVWPAVGYRVDYRGRSVVISGDTNASENLFVAAKNADLLLHDALSRTLLDPMITTAREANQSRMAKIMTDVIDYHADSTSIEARAREAGVRQLVLYHLVPVPMNALTEKMFSRGLASTTILARDLQTFDLPTDSTQINIREP
ncbi:MAG: MBL fold metallo-hydrolase [Gammaproteobacteria bacterium]|nr:MBL fold metallo-hydrolase [Gammaproteobacteria bacterium]